MCDDKYQLGHIIDNFYQTKTYEIEKEEESPRNRVANVISIGVLSGLVGQYAGNIVSNIIEKRPLEEVLVPEIGPAYYANVIAGGVGAILALYLDTDIFIIAATIINQVLIDLFIKLENKAGYNAEELVYAIIRNAVGLLAIIKIFKALSDISKDQILREGSTFDELLMEAIIIGVIVNSTISVLYHYASLEDLRLLCKVSLSKNN